MLLPALALVAPPAQAQPTGAQVARDGDAIVFQGRIDGGSAARFLELLREPGVARVVITSQGGLVEAALDMAQAIAARQLDVEVPRACLSSCANYVFAAGRAKRLGHARAVGWHGNMAHVLHLQQSGQASWSEPQLQDARRLAVREQAFFERQGVDGFVCWFGKLAPHHVDEFYALTPQDMAGFGIGGVSVAPGSAPPGAPPLIAVDWEQLETWRPFVTVEAP